MGKSGILQNLFGDPYRLKLKLVSSIESTRRYAIRFVNFWISLVALASTSVIMWYFQPIDDAFAQATLVVLAALMAALSLLDGLNSDSKRHIFRPEIAWYSVLSVAAVIIMLGSRLHIVGLVINVASLTAALPALWIYYKVTRGEYLLMLWLVPLLLITSLYLVPPVTSTGITFDLLFLPVPIVSYGCIVWALITKSLLHARRVYNRPIYGPGIEGLAMIFLVAPIVALTMLAVNALSGDDIWVAVSGVLVGLIFGNTVSQPIGAFMRDLGQIQENTKCDDAAKLE